MVDAAVVRAWWTAGGFSLLAVVVSLHLIRGHLRNFTNRAEQAKIVGILWMVPIYAVESWLSLRFTDYALYLDLGRDCYEAYVIYLFQSLMITYLGGGHDHKVVQILQTLPPMQHPFPGNLWWPPIAMDKEFLRRCKFATLQFVVLKPLATLMALVLEANGWYEEGSFSLSRGYVYIAFTLNLSVTWAFYYLVLFYLALRRHLAPHRPVAKFVCIKTVLFLSFWQSVVVAGLAKLEILHELGDLSTADVATGLQDLLICIEMAGAAFAHRVAFPYAPYAASAQEAGSARAGLLSDNFAVDSTLRDFNEVMPVVLPTGFKPHASTGYREPAGALPPPSSSSSSSVELSGGGGV